MIRKRQSFGVGDPQAVGQGCGVVCGAAHFLCHLRRHQQKRGLSGLTTVWTELPYGITREDMKNPRSQAGGPALFLVVRETEGADSLHQGLNKLL